MNAVRLMYTSPYNFMEFESWLSSMAKQGMMLSSVSFYSCSFKKLNPCNMEYRLEFSGDKLGPKIGRQYRASGWKPVCSWNGVHVFSMEKHEEIQEVHTSPEEYMKMMKRAQRTVLFELLLLLCGGTFIASLFLSTLCSGLFWLNLLDLFVFTLVGVMAYAVLLSVNIQDMIMIKRIKKKIADNRTINHNVPIEVKRKRPLARLESIMITISLIFCLYTTAFYTIDLIRTIKGTNMEKINLNSNQNIIRLNDVEERDYSLVDKDEYYNSITKDRHILYKQYSAYEQFAVPGEEWQGKEYEPYLDTEFYELYIAGLAHKVAGDIVQESENPDYWSPNSDIMTSRVQYKGLDEVYYIHSDIDNIYTVIARSGSRVIKLSYSGKRPYTDLLEAVAEKL